MDCGCGQRIIIAFLQHGTGGTVRLDATPIDPPPYQVVDTPHARPVAVVTRGYRRHQCGRREAKP